MIGTLPNFRSTTIDNNSWDDNRLTVSLLNPLGKEGYATDLFRRMNERKLFKRIYSKPLRKFENPIIRDFLDKINKNKSKKEIEASLADLLSSNLSSSSIDPNYLIVNSMNIKSIRKQSRDDEEGSIMIVDGDIHQSFENESTLFRSINENEHDSFIEVYAPISYSHDEEKRRILNRCELLIHDFLIKQAEILIEKERKNGSRQNNSSTHPLIH
ncbi:MAG: hypothetical protein AB1656_26225 [Candidatus Omnitrophota bacterium]